MKKSKKIIAAVASASIVATLGLTGCASIQQGMNTWDTEMNGRARTVEVYSLDGQKIAEFNCRCTIEYDERTAIYGNSIVVATDKGGE